MEVTCLVLYIVCAMFNIIFILFAITRFVRNRSNRKKGMLNRKIEKNNTLWFCDFSQGSHLVALCLGIVMGNRDRDLSVNANRRCNPFEPEFTIVISFTTSRELLSQFSTCSG